MTKSILILAIAAAFVAGTITTTAIPIAEAADKSHQDILNAINNGVNSILNAITGAKNEIKTDTAAIKAKTDNLPVDPASNSHIDTAIASIPSDALTEAQFKTLKCNAPIRSGVDLSGCDLTRADLRGAELTRADLRGTIFFGADLSGANLKMAKLNGAIFTLAKLEGANLQEADLRNAFLHSAHLEGANLMNAFIEGATFTNCIGDPIGTPANGVPLPNCS
jgi:hypothetical protein